MKEEKDLFDMFRDKDHDAREQPSAEAWKKLSEKLDTHQQGNEKPTVRLLPRFNLLAMAASILLLVGIAFVVIPRVQDSSQDNQTLRIGTEPMIIEDLAYAKPEGFYAIAIKTNQYYNTSPKYLAQEGAHKKLQLTKRNVDIKAPIAFQSIEKVKDKYDDALADNNSALGQQERIEADNVKAEVVFDQVVAADESFEVNADILEEFDSKESELALQSASTVESQEEVVVSGYGASKKSSRAQLSEPKTSAPPATDNMEYVELDAVSNVIAYQANNEEADVNYFNWLIGNWKSESPDGQLNIQNWSQKDEFTLSGKAILIINGKETNVENMEIKRIGDQLYFIRANSIDGEELRYRLTSQNFNEAVFDNEEIGDQFRIFKNSENQFSNAVQANGSIQLNQYPRTNNSNILFNRVNKKR